MSQEVRAAETAVERFLFENDVPDEDVSGAVQEELTAAEQALIEAEPRPAWPGRRST